jgi:hypothetical protein
VIRRPSVTRCRLGFERDGHGLTPVDLSREDRSSRRTGRWKTASVEADFDPYLPGMPRTNVELSGRFIELARTCGPVVFELQPERIVLCGTRRIFAAVQITTSGLNGHLNLARHLTDRRRWRRRVPCRGV